jgi:hypothetical protein
MPKLNLDQARKAVAGADVDAYDARICLPCLSLVSFPLRDGNMRAALGACRSVTRDLWAEGLEGYAFEVVGSLCDRGVPGARRAKDDLTEHGGQSATARALVLALAAELTRRTEIELSLESRARERLALAPPELN